MFVLVKRRSLFLPWIHSRPLSGSGRRLA